MARPTETGDRTIHLDGIEAWSNADGVFLASSDPDAEFIHELTGDAKQKVLGALTKLGRQTTGHG
jgi:hypothetical protein